MKSLRYKCREHFFLVPLLICGFLTVSNSAGHDLESAKAITSWRELHDLTTEQAGRRYPAHLRVVVTYAPSDKPHFWAQDETGGGFAWFPNVPASHLALGQVIDIRGETDPGAFGPCIKVTGLRVLRSGPPPSPSIIPLQKLLSGIEDGRRIQLAAQIVAVRFTSKPKPVTNLVIMVEGARLPVVLDGAPSQAMSELLDADVRLTAVTSVTFNERRQFTGIAFNVARPEDLIVLKAGTADLPKTNIRDLLSYRPKVGVETQRVRVEGVVTYYNPDRLLVIQDSDGPVAAQIPEAKLRVGDRISILGNPVARGYTPVLMDARAVVLGHYRDITPQNVSIQQALSGKYDTSLVRLKGLLIDRTYAKEQQILTVRDGDTAFRAELAGSSKAFISGLQVGSYLAVTGVLRSRIIAPSTTPQGFSLLLRSNDDVMVLSRPSWLTNQNLSVIAIVLAALLLLILFWVTLLRRKVQRQTKKLVLQRQKEAQLANSYSMLIENATDLVFRLDMEGRFQSVNPAAERSTGFSKEELTRTSLDELILAEQRHEFQAWLRRLGEQRDATGEIEIQARSGKTHVLELSAHIATSSEGTNSVECIGRDITSRRRIQASLVQARADADAANLAKSRFVANMSHEIRTPLNAILGVAELLSETDLTSQQRQYVDLFQSSGNSLLHVINGILDLSKVESGQLQLESIPFQLEEVVSETVSILSARAESKGLRLSYAFGGARPPRITGDANRLRQILTNLIGNAIKFTHEGSVTLNIDIEPPPDQARLDVIHLKFVVVDTGIGIAGDKLDMIFDRFTQADDSTTRRYGGTGLGLSISKGLATAMGGSITVSSELGRGSQMTVRLPFTLAPPSAGQTPAEAQHRLRARPEGRISRSPGKVLLVEDSEPNRFLVMAYMRGMPVHVDCAPNGRVAVEQEARESFDLILMDIEMPEMDGYEATRQICARRRAAGLPNIPVVALTAHAFERAKETAREAGCVDVLTKPIAKAVLLATLDRYLQPAHIPEHTNPRFVPRSDKTVITASDRERGPS